MIELTQTDEQRLLMMVAYAGDANAKVFDALDAYETNNLDKALHILNEAQEELLNAHRRQHELLSEEANGGEVTPSILLIHAMDICMSAANSIQHARKLITLLESRKK